jgi:hypothetical protein
MDPNNWGPKLWFSLHSVSFTYPFYPTEKDKEHYKTFYQLLEHTLPCGLCRENYKKHIKLYPIEPQLENRKKIAYWVIDMHNMVNIENKKPTLSYGEVLDIYEGIYGRKIYLVDPDPHKPQNNILDDSGWKEHRKKKIKIIFLNNFVFFSVLIFLIIILLIVYLCTRKNKTFI